MAGLILAMDTVLAAQAPTVHDALSGIFGSVSLTAWICLLLPQLIANYKAKSADGLSMGFLFIWLLGDVTNFAGALLTNLAPTAVALACYFCISDLILISQCSYYNILNKKLRSRRRSHGALSGVSDDTDATAVADGNDAPRIDAEQQPLLVERQCRTRSLSVGNGGLPGSHRRHSIRHEESGLDPLRRIVTGEDDGPDSNPWLHNALSLLAVWVVGAAGWFISFKMGAWEADDDDGAPGASNESLALLGMVLGYASACCYLMARIPQIVKNWRERSTDGLAVLFFLLSLTGNMTYGASLLSYADSWQEILRATPWLLGSLGTIAEDLVIFAQFRMYSSRPNVKNTSAA